MSSRACRNLCHVTLSPLIVFVLPAALARAQSISEYPIPGPPPAGVLTMTAGPDGAVWFGEARKSQLARVAPDGTITEFSTTAGKAVYVVVTGPDGNLWFADGDDVGKMTPTGQVSFVSVPFASPGVGADPDSITSGPQGALWVALGGTHAIAKVTTTGQVTIFPVPVADVQGVYPYTIAAGPDGNLWYTDDEGDFVGRMTPAGVVQTFPVPSGTQPKQIIAGPDGAMWFSAFAGGLGRISTSGDVHMFPFNAYATQLTAGPDGNIWFTNSTCCIGRMTPEGVVTQFPLSDSTALPQAIAAGPDGAIWFEEANSNKIGRITTGAAAALCTPDAHTLCLNSGRFSATVQFQSTAGGATVDANAVSLTDATGYFWFFDSGNVELIVKVLNGCGVNGAYWVFAAGLTNVGVHLVVNDLTRGQQQMWDNGVGTAFAPVQDTVAFHTCP